MTKLQASIFLMIFVVSQACKAQIPSSANPVIQPVFVTDTLKHDSDDPAIWVNPQNPNKSLILGTDKNQDGA